VKFEKPNWWRTLLAVALLLQFAWCELAALQGPSTTVWVRGHLAGALVVAAIYGAAILALVVGPRARLVALRVVVVVVAVLFSARFLAVRSLVRTNARRFALTSASPDRSSAALIELLRETAAAQEQYRLRAGSYAGAMDSLREWITVPGVHDVQLTRHGDLGWAAHASLDGRTCTMWVRDSTLRPVRSDAEGSPACGQQYREKNQILHTVLAAPNVSGTGFRSRDIRGVWLQHRADDHHTATVPDATAEGPYTWTTRIGGEIKASVAVAGNQVFVGAHGNGELVVLTLDSGKVGFRIRVPNWVHHQPAVTADLMVVGFGNNERNQLPFPGLGSEPSGVAAYDRRTGVERWRRYTSGSVMTSPVVRDSIVAVVSSAKEAIAWRLSDGKELWRTPMPGMTPMGNPMLRDTVLFVGVEKATLCALDVRSGARLYCRDQLTHGWGGGHASVAILGDAVLQVFDEGVTTSSGASDGRWLFVLARLLRLPVGAILGQQVLVGEDAATGQERWRVRLGIGEDHKEAGHMAGTPVVMDGVAYVASPVSGRIYAVRADSGRTVWSRFVNTARGSVLVTQGVVLAATRDTTMVVLDQVTGAVRCTQRIPGLSDRAGLTLAGTTGILTTQTGLVVARPIAEWTSCKS
jgi:outer membrane protein assembly factor BamB